MLGFRAIIASGLLLTLVSCGSDKDSTEGTESAVAAERKSHERMVRVLAKVAKEDANSNPYYSDFRIRMYQTALARVPPNAAPETRGSVLASLGVAQMDYGLIEESIQTLQMAYALFLKGKNPEHTIGEVSFALGMALPICASRSQKNCCAQTTTRTAASCPFNRRQFIPSGGALKARSSIS